VGACSLCQAGTFSTSSGRLWAETQGLVSGAHLSNIELGRGLCKNMAIAEFSSYWRVRTDWMGNGCWIGKGLPLCCVGGPCNGLAHAHHDVTVCESTGAATSLACGLCQAGTYWTGSG
jgi:hypothetical protein